MDYGPLSRLSAVKSAPDDWSLVVADIRSSTRAVQEGRYRDVNLIGTACIAAIRNKFSPLEIPYVFGGDGATFLVPATHLQTCLNLLEGIKNLAESTLKLNLMIGHMSVQEIRATGHEIYYGFLSWSQTEHLPFFRGDGVRYAERMIKNKVMPPLIQSTDSAFKADINGLSCRLLPFPSTRGRVLSIMIEGLKQGAEEDEILSSILKQLIQGGPLERLRPISHQNHRRPWLNSQWKSEALLHSGTKGLFAARFRTLFESLLGTLLVRFNIPNPILGKPSDYTNYMLEQTDWIKMDGTLRLVLDITAEEEKGLLKLLDEMEGARLIRYGYHGSDGTVMTCHFQSVIGQQHAHFIDGTGGGLTQAATHLKSKVS